MSNILIIGDLVLLDLILFLKKIAKENFVVNIDSETYASIDKPFLNLNQIKTTEVIIKWYLKNKSFLN